MIPKGWKCDFGIRLYGISTIDFRVIGLLISLIISMYPNFLVIYILTKLLIVHMVLTGVIHGTNLCLILFCHLNYYVLFMLPINCSVYLSTNILLVYSVVFLLFTCRWVTQFLLGKTEIQLRSSIS
jgi:hypothetical protein